MKETNSQTKVSQDHCGDRLQHHGYPKSDAEVMPAAGSKWNDRIGSIAPSGLLAGRTGSRLYGYAEINIVAIGDTTIDTAGMVGSCGTLGIDQCIIMAATGHTCSSEARPELYGLYCRYRENGMADEGLERIEKRFAQANRYT